MIAEAPRHLHAVEDAMSVGADALHPWSVELLNPRQPGRAEAESFIEAIYARTFDSRISSHYPTLVSIRDERGAIQAVVGLRFADEHVLFLEQYLDEPVEIALTQAFGVPASRADVAEIGNLAAEDHRASRRLFAEVATYLLQHGRTHAVATATRQLRRRFRRIGLATASLASARPERLAGGAQAWGRYYGRDPEVVAGAIRATSPHILAAPRAGKAESER